MPTAAREYIASRGLGDLAACRETMNEFAASVNALNPPGAPERASFFARILLSYSDANEELLSPDKVNAATDGTFPCLWVNLTFDPDRLSVTEIEPLEVKLALRFLGGAHSAISFPPG